MVWHCTRTRSPGHAKTPRRRNWPWYFEITEEVKGAKKWRRERRKRFWQEPPISPDTTATTLPLPPGTNTVISTETDWALLTSKFEERNEFYLVRGNIAMRRDGKTVPTFAGYGLHCSPLTHAVLLICNTATYFLIQNLSQENLVLGIYFHNNKNYRIRSL